MSKPRGLYTPVFQSLTTHRKTSRAAAALKCDRLKLVGHLIALWTWSLDNMTAEGGPMLPAELAFAAEWPLRKAAEFAGALEASGFIDRRDGTGYYLHDWQHYGGKVAARAAYDRDRKAGTSSEIPGNPAGIPVLDRDRDRDRDLDRDLSVSNPPTPRRLSPEQERLRVKLHHHASDRVLKGVRGMGAPDSDWCVDLIERGATESDIDYAIQGALNVRTLKYTRAILQRRVEERENGIDHDQLARDRAESARREPHGRSPGARGVARHSEGPGSLDEFDDLPPDAIRPADHAGAAEEIPGAGEPLSFTGRAQAGGGAR